jgi:hypothetical protein
MATSSPAASSEDEDGDGATSDSSLDGEFDSEWGFTAAVDSMDRGELRALLAATRKRARRLAAEATRARDDLASARTRVRELLAENSALKRGSIDLRRLVTNRAGGSPLDPAAAEAAAAVAGGGSGSSNAGGGSAGSSGAGGRVLGGGARASLILRPASRRVLVRESHATQLSFLKSVPLFRSFSEAQFAKMCVRLVPVEYADGDVIIRQVGGGHRAGSRAFGGAGVCV